jgi:hypothetical protein
VVGKKNKKTSAETGRLGDVDVEPAKELDSKPKPASETEAAWA